MQPSKFFYFKNILKLTTQEILGPRFCTSHKPTWVSSWEPCQFFYGLPSDIYCCKFNKLILSKHTQSELGRYPVLAYCQFAHIFCARLRVRIKVSKLFFNFEKDVEHKAVHSEKYFSVIWEKMKKSIYHFVPKSLTNTTT